MINCVDYLVDNALISRLSGSLQNKWISGASAIQERLRALSARPEKSVCSHTIVYALPPPGTP